MQQEGTRLALRMDFPRGLSLEISTHGSKWERGRSIPGSERCGMQGESPPRLPTEGSPQVQLPAFLAHPGSEYSGNFQATPRWSEPATSVLLGSRLSSRLLLL